ncbi:hypothetical protein H4J51_07815 [Colwellia sp. MB02u-18]|uniref:hypothetical protein n=1 Tax=unclassified Colwellia TaxID=196834 RepID=UPI0015F5E7B6|nr:MULTISPECIES: hypothetical protein [unclassified Colwellia]MBA6223791.1 hypothetical protein [Colwellia sp. MB3u-45]MBA6268521.1 hypothetical protein [Colwellia sp. MB3u-43]MBA6319972.1 hypothetical protein [Colwellia sp. MB02u-19]MBA6324484.1 hypothetical protein [Colwellia sp. MB02u-18]MBA6330639.1 hypothetical protein [Colwellia sp. MB02u-12]
MPQKLACLHIVTLSPGVQAYTNAVQLWIGSNGHVIVTHPDPENKNASQVTGIYQQFTC